MDFLENKSAVIRFNRPELAGSDPEAGSDPDLWYRISTITGQEATDAGLLTLYNGLKIEGYRFNASNQLEKFVGIADLNNLISVSGGGGGEE